MSDQKLSDLSDEQLKELWLKGRDWLNQNEQSVKKEEYNQELYLRCLKRLETIEDELQKRGVKYG